MYRNYQEKEERIELADQIVMIQKLIDEKEIQINILNTWLKKIQEKANEKVDAKFRP